jgi:hypothetical protein
MASKRLTRSSKVVDDNEPECAEKEGSIIKIYIPRLTKFFLDEEDENFEKSISKFHKKRLQITNQTSTDFFEKSMNSALLISVAARFQLSDREFLHIATAFAKANGHDIASSTISHSTIRRRRLKLEAELAQNIRSDFIQNQAPPYLIIHWDGKIMTDTTTGK